MDISSLFGSSNSFAELIKARQRLAGQAVNPNATAESVKKSINDSTYLNKSSKQTLSKLTDTVDQFAEGNAKLLRDIQGISNLMQFANKEEITDNTSAAVQLLKAQYTPGDLVNFSA